MITIVACHSLALNGDRLFDPRHYASHVWGDCLRCGYPIPEHDVILNAKIPARQSTVVAISVIREGLFYAYVSPVEGKTRS